jgi:tetratricopeptide (TPR) repeat protein
MTEMVKYRAGLALIVGISWAAIGSAQTPLAEGAAPPPSPEHEACVAPSAQDTEDAKQAFRDGQVAFSEGDYSHAAELWRWAYDRDCSAHALLLNLATALELLGHPDQAAETLTRFDERVPDSPYVTANQKRIARLQRVRVSPVRPRRETPRACPPAAPLVVERGRDGMTFPLGVAMGGAVAALVGGAVYIQARSAATGAADGCGGQPGQCSSVGSLLEGERARARAETSGWIAGAGLVTLAGGLVWHFVSSRTAPRDAAAGASEPIRLGSNLSANRLGLSLSGGF